MDTEKRIYYNNRKRIKRPCQKKNNGLHKQNLK